MGSHFFQGKDGNFSVYSTEELAAAQAHAQKEEMSSMGGGLLAVLGAIGSGWLALKLGATAWGGLHWTAIGGGALVGLVIGTKLGGVVLVGALIAAAWWVYRMAHHAG